VARIGRAGLRHCQLIRKSAPKKATATTPAKCTLAKAAPLHRAFAANHFERFDDHLLLQCRQRSRGANGNSHQRTAAHNGRSLSVPRLQCAVWALRSVNQADHGRAPHRTPSGSSCRPSYMVRRTPHWTSDPSPPENPLMQIRSAEFAGPSAVNCKKST
jgi:hypothetical protein